MIQLSMVAADVIGVTPPRDAAGLDGFFSSFLGLGVVFAGMMAIMAVVLLVRSAKSRTRPRRGDPGSGAPMAIEAPKGAQAPCSRGEVKLHAVPKRTAALIMAIVADEMQEPLNELNFISIREVQPV